MGSGAAEGAPADRQALGSLSHLDNSVPTRCQEPSVTQFFRVCEKGLRTQTSVFWHLLKTKILTTRFPVPPLYTCLYGE